MRMFAALVAAFASLALGAGTADAKRTLRLTVPLPLKSVLGQNLLQFKDEVEKATGGNLDIQIFDSGQLYDDKDVPNAVAAGQIEVGVTSLAQYAADVPAVDVFHVPFMFDSDAKLRAAAASGSPVREPIDEAIAATGSRVLWWQAYGGTVLLTKGGQPIKTPSDIKGKKVRALSKLQGTWISANGGVPVAVASSEQYVAYQRGTVDVGMTGPDSIKSRKLFEVMDTVTVVNMAAIEFVVVINEKIFQSLTEEERLAILAASKNAETKLREEFTHIERQALEVGRQNKMAVYAPNAAEMEAFRKSAEAVRIEFLKTAGPVGRIVFDAALALK
jgi:C4-dicarboxylate-binding protein DctP